MKRSSINRANRDKRPDSPRCLKRRESAGLSEVLQDEPELADVQEASTKCKDGSRNASRALLNKLGVPIRPADNTLGHFIMKYLNEIEANACAAHGNYAAATKPFDLHRLEPFAGSMNETPTDLMRACGGLFMELTSHLENLNEVRGREHTTLFKNCVEQRLKVSHNILTLHEFAKHAIEGRSSDLSSDLPYQERNLNLVVASPLEMPQRGGMFAKDDLIRNAAIYDRVENYQVVLAHKRRSMIQRTPDTEKLFSCLLQQSAIMALISASEELSRHNITYDGSSVADIAAKYDHLHTTLAKIEEAKSRPTTTRKTRI
ncbi:hypothetical protein BV898_05805 [Hypsibius exemplaris]|uniref:Uncharacterized protein n=1 Tax=Hypsibius exemplaris TaxID=2072580 RepID=A0A1W0WYJ3_HYPEX|nr:hypothetical protein BV898_05805 [Hypsibius exemplaris]